MSRAGEDNNGSGVQHVPAWKRIGLKLKNAPATTHSISHFSNDEQKSSEKQAGPNEAGIGGLKCGQGPNEADIDGSKCGQGPIEADIEGSKFGQGPIEADIEGLEFGQGPNEANVEGLKCGQGPIEATLGLLKRARAPSQAQRSSKKAKITHDTSRDAVLSIKSGPGQLTPTEYLPTTLQSADGPEYNNSVRGVHSSNTAHNDPLSQVPAPLKRKKSVTFTCETKDDDGTSAEKFYKDWQQSTTLDDTGFSPDQVADFQPPPAVHPANQPSNASFKPSKNDRKVKLKDKGQKEPKQSVSPGVVSAESPVYLRYLRQYHTEREHWKFSKGNQTDLFKNIWKLNLIPPSDNQALRAYLAGLQGVAAQQRLAESAEDILKQVSEAQRAAGSSDGGRTAETAPMDNREARISAYIDALHRQIERCDAAGEGACEYDDAQLEEERQDVERGKRAEIVLAALLPKLPVTKATQPVAAAHYLPPTAMAPKQRKAAMHTVFVDDDEQPAETSAKPANALHGNARKRNRKARTTDLSLSDASSSSSSDSSDSDSSSSVIAVAVKASQAPPEKKPIFDNSLLDTAFPKTQIYSEIAVQRRAADGAQSRGFAYTHGTSSRGE